MKSFEKELSCSLDAVFKQEFAKDKKRGLEILIDLYHDEPVLLYESLDDWAEEMGKNAFDILLHTYEGNFDEDEVEAYLIDMNNEIIYDDPFIWLENFSCEEKLDILNYYGLCLELAKGE